VEFIYNEEEQEIYMLEVNTHPGMTPLSICPEIVGLQGISYTSLVEQLLKDAKFEG
jgi:D-alanine-D-alanine ligase